MKILRAALLPFFFLLTLLAACQESPSTEPNPNGTATPILSVATPVGGTAAAEETPLAPPATAAQTAAPSAVAQAAYCKNGGAVAVAASDPLAAKVNGQPIPLSEYQRQVAQAQAALQAQGLDPKSANGQETLKGLNQQVLGQLIDDVIVEQAAQQQSVSISGQDVNNRIQQMIDDAGGRDKFDAYLKTTQLQLDDLCTQIRASLYGEAMLARVTTGLPTKVEQAHAAQILLASQSDANNVLSQLQSGKDFAALAKQYSKDEATRDNGGDLGWFPKGVMPPEFETVVFQMQPGQISGVVSTQLGFHIIKLLERDPARELSSDLLQNQKQQAFLAWLESQRNTAKIEKFVNP